MSKMCIETTGTGKTSSGTPRAETKRAETTHAENTHVEKTQAELVRHALHGSTMGTRWSALFFAEAGYDPAPLVLGPDKGATIARQRELDALFLLRNDDGGTREVGVGPLFFDESAVIVATERA